MLGLLVEDVTLIKKDAITAHVRFRGGETKTLTLPLPMNAWQGRMTPDSTLHQIDALLDDHTDSEVAAILNERGLKTGADRRFSAERIRWFRFTKGFKSLKQRLLDKGWLTTQQYADKLGVHYGTIKAWRDKRTHPRTHVQRPRSMALRPTRQRSTDTKATALTYTSTGDNPSYSETAAGGAV